MSVYSYADESGTHEDSRVVVIAAWVSSYKRWLRFERQWRHELCAQKAPYLHMRELGPDARKHHDNRFRSWSDERVDKLVRAMVPIARDNAIFGLICAVDTAGYQRLHPALKAAGSSYPTAYVFAFQAFFEALLKVLNGYTTFEHGITTDEVCHLVFDQGPQQDNANKAFHLLKEFKDHHYRFASIAFEHSREHKEKNGAITPATLQLQGSDLLANRAYAIYHTEKVHKKEIELGTVEWELKAAGNLLVDYIDERRSIEFSAEIEKKYGLPR
jgi:hypothetical protein